MSGKFGTPCVRMHAEKRRSCVDVAGDPTEGAVVLPGSRLLQSLSADSAVAEPAPSWRSEPGRKTRVEVGSGKFGTPWARMQVEKPGIARTCEDRLAGGCVVVFVVAPLLPQA